MALFSARDISKTYGSGATALTVLKGVTLTAEAGEMTAVVGASGSGKTTLLQILGTLDAPSGGEIFFRDKPLLSKTAGELARFRNETIGFIFQFHHLLPDFTALENVMIPGLIAGKTRKEMTDSATELLGLVELNHRLHHKVGELSGGEQQRAALARALIMQPELLLADEPTGNLDSRAGHLVFDLLHNLCRQRKLCAIMVTHNMELAARMDHRLTLQDGVLARDR
jgi:lipoprotein-releasing system ATP-binding protein